MIDSTETKKGTCGSVRHSFYKTLLVHVSLVKLISLTHRFTKGYRPTLLQEFPIAATKCVQCFFLLLLVLWGAHALSLLLGTRTRRVHARLRVSAAGDVAKRAPIVFST